MFGKGYGMPSSHSQFVAFFAVFLTLFLLFRHKPTRSATMSATSFSERLFLSTAACLGATAVALSRIYLTYHTFKQVAVGAAAGSVSAIAWFLFIAYLRWDGWVIWSLDTRLARTFRVRDLVVNEDLVDIGWARWLERRRLVHVDGCSLRPKIS